MSQLTLKQRIELWEKGLDRLAIEIDRHGVDGEKLLPLFERFERELEADQNNSSTMSAVQDRLARLKEKSLAKSQPSQTAARS